jgi:ABC-type spermidine/putrescine transport system permease subunit II
MIVMSVFSFNDSKAQTLPYAGLTTRWYEDFFADNEIHEAIFYSLRVAALVVTIGAVMGILFAMIIQRMHFRGKTVFQALVAIPLALPGIVLAISLLIVFHQVGVEPGYFTIVLGHATFVTPLIMFIVLQRLRTLDTTLEQASMDLGANWIKTFWHVTLPELRITIIAACLLGFTISVDEITVTLFLAGIKLTLPVFVWTLLRYGFSPEVNAAFTIIGVGSVIVIVAAGLMLAWGGGRRRPAVGVGEGA